jgi:hypothetical protein
MEAILGFLGEEAKIPTVTGWIGEFVSGANRWIPLIQNRNRPECQSFVTKFERPQGDDE